MRRYLFAIYLLVFALLSFHAKGGTYTLLNGEMLSGDPISFNETGLIVKKSDGSFSTRTPWEKFTQDSLKFLKDQAESPKDKEFIDPFIEEVAQTEIQRREIVIKEVVKPERPTGKVGLSAAFSSPLFILIFFIIYLANLYAAYEIALYKYFQPAMVCGVSAAAPLLGPIVFLCIPANPDPLRDTTADVPAAQTVTEVIPLSGHPDLPTDDTAPHDSNPVLSENPEDPASTAPALPSPIVFRRGEFSFNRRFFETKLPGFFRVVPGETEKDMVVVIKAARGEFTGKRITNVTQSELHLQVFKNEATHDEMIPFNEIQEVRIRHKDAT